MHKQIYCTKCYFRVPTDGCWNKENNITNCEWNDQKMSRDMNCKYTRNHILGKKSCSKITESQMFSEVGNNWL